jgi:hypothetical protein
MAMIEPLIRTDSQFDSVDRSSSDYTDRLLTLMTVKLELVESLYALSASQQALLPGEDVSSLLGVIARRETLIDQLSQVQHQLQPYQVDDPERRVWCSPDRRDTCLKVVGKIEKLMKEVLRLDGQTLDAMCQQRDTIAAELRHGLDSNLAERAYAPNDSLQQSVLDINDL